MTGYRITDRVSSAFTRPRYQASGAYVASWLKSYNSLGGETSHRRGAKRIAAHS